MKRTTSRLYHGRKAAFTLAMRMALGCSCAALLLTACLQPQPPPNHPPPPVKKNPPKPYVTPDLSSFGHVEMVNAQGRFVVLSFPPGHMPRVGQHWRIKRGGLNVGRVTITGPQRDLDTVADLVEGDAKIGDEAAPE